MSQGIYWLLTIPHAEFLPYLPPNCSYIRGQLELSTTGYLHWQLLVICTKKCRLAAIRKLFGPVHCELSKSEAANEYVWKEETRVEGFYPIYFIVLILRYSIRTWIHTSFPCT